MSPQSNHEFPQRRRTHYSADKVVYALMFFLMIVGVFVQAYNDNVLRTLTIVLVGSFTVVGILSVFIIEWVRRTQSKLD